MMSKFVYSCVVMFKMITVIDDFKKLLCDEFSEKYQVGICRFFLKSLDEFSFFCFSFRSNKMLHKNFT